MKLSIIIVSWNVRDILAGCIESILLHEPSCRYEIIVVDNAGTDGTAEFMESRYPFVKLIKNTENRGFALANNQGAGVSSGEYLLFLNPDTIILPGSLDLLVAFLDKNPEVAVCGPRILNEDGTLQTSVRNFPTFRGALYRYTIFKYLGLFKSYFEKWHNRAFDYERQADVEQLIGAAMLIRRDVFVKTGSFDEQFFMYYEEVDLCFRLKKNGLRIVYYPDAQIVHLGGKSAEQIPAMTRFMMFKSLLLYFRKQSNPFAYMVFSVIFKVGILSRQLFELLIYYAGFRLCRLINKPVRAYKNHIRYKSALDFLVKYYLKIIFVK